MSKIVDSDMEDAYETVYIEDKYFWVKEDTACIAKAILSLNETLIELVAAVENIESKL